MHNNHLVKDHWERHNGTQTTSMWSEKRKKYEEADKNCHIDRLHEIVIKNDLVLKSAQSPKHESKGHLGEKRTECNKCRVNKNEKPCQGAQNMGM